MKKVDFLIVGAQKSGTTALYQYLRQHPIINMSKVKEIHFFDNEKNFENQNVPYDKYHEFFPQIFHPNLWGEATPIYMYWNNSIERIWKYNPNIKLIVLLRNPMERAYSHWNMECDRDAESLSFFEAIKNEETRTQKALPFKHRVFSYVDRGFYVEQLRNIYRYFPKKQVLVLKYESLKKDYEQTLLSICNFLEIEKHEFKELKNIHSRKYKQKISLEEYNFLRNIFIHDIEHLEKTLNWDCSEWKKKKKKKKVLFYRDYRSYTGGQQKYFDYYQHFKAHSDFEVEICFSKDSIWSADNIWAGEVAYMTNDFKPENYDILFIAGMDWNVISEGVEDNLTVINFIQGMRHTNVEHKLHSFLKRKAIRIVVSPIIQDRLEKQQSYNGTLFTIENGVNLVEKNMIKEFDVYILGLKNLSLANDLTVKLKELGFNVYASTKKISKENVHLNMAKATITLLLPNLKEGEGFYLPALESMYFSDITIVPDCLGNQSFCFHQINCLMPKYEFNSMVNSCLEAKILLTNDAYQPIKEQALKTVKEHSLEEERIKLYSILRSI